MRIVLLLPLMLSAFVLNAQDGRGSRSLFNDSTALTGGFFDLALRYSEVLGTDAVVLGFNGGVVLNDHWHIGLGGAFSTSVIKNQAYERFLRDSSAIDTQGGLELKYGYGGVFIQPVLFHRSVVHVALPVLLGAGGVNYSYPAPNGNNSQRNRIEGQAFFAFEPGLEVEVSIIRGFRIGLGGSYLFTSDLSLPETAPDALRTASARLSLKVGGF